MARLLTKILITCAILCGSAAVATVASVLYGRDEFMSVNDAEKKWGKADFDAEKFKNGNEAVRASMAMFLITSKRFVGKPLASVRAELGASTGYYVNDGIPSYIITPEQPKGGKRVDVWQIVFLPDKDWKKVDEVKIHKNCCY
jgi:hypothetical protein